MGERMTKICKNCKHSEDWHSDIGCWASKENKVTCDCEKFEEDKS